MKKVRGGEYVQSFLDNIKCLITGIGTVFTWIVGLWDIPLLVLISFMGLDYITGVIKGYINKEISSSSGFKGLLKKSVIFIVLIISVLLDRLLNNGAFVFRTMVCYFYIANEGISIVENCIQLGVPIPEKIKEVLLQLKKGDNK